MRHCRNTGQKTAAVVAAICIRLVHDNVSFVIGCGAGQPITHRRREATRTRRAENASGGKAQPSCLRGSVRCGLPRTLLCIGRALGRRAGRLDVRVATACSAQCTIRRFVHNEVVVGRLNGADAQVVGQKESTIDALREAPPSASWRHVACERAVDSRCRIAESFDIVARAQGRRPVPCVCNEQDRGAHLTAAPRRAETAALSMPMVDGRRTC